MLKIRQDDFHDMCQGVRGIQSQGNGQWTLSYAQGFHQRHEQ